MLRYNLYVGLETGNVSIVKRIFYHSKSEWCVCYYAYKPVLPCYFTGAFVKLFASRLVLQDPVLMQYMWVVYKNTNGPLKQQPSHVITTLLVDLSLAVGKTYPSHKATTELHA